MRIVFCGTPEFAIPSLRRLLAEPGVTIEAVVTQPDRPRGRVQLVSGSAVKKAALKAGLHVYQPEKIKSDSAYDFFKRVRPDAVVIIAYGQIIPARLIEVPPLGWINLHASLLPKYRGAAPVHHAIANGEIQTGLTTMQIDAGMDTGGILLQQTIEIRPDETAPELLLRMAEAGAPLVAETLKKLGSGELTARAQDHSQATLAPILKKEDGRIDWRLNAAGIYNRMRGFHPWPGAFTTFRGKLAHLWGRPARNVTQAVAVTPGTILATGGEIHVACGGGTCIRLSEVHVEGRRRLAARDFANGARLEPGERFGA